MNAVTQYMNYIRPEWAPEPWVFGPVWTVLYILISVSFGFIAYKFTRGEVDRMTALPFMLNLGFNIIFTYLQFGLQNLFLASIDMLLILGTLIWALFEIEKKYRWVAVVNLPNLAWVSYATVLQLTITYLNS